MRISYRWGPAPGEKGSGYAVRSAGRTVTDLLGRGELLTKRTGGLTRIIELEDAIDDGDALVGAPRLEKQPRECDRRFQPAGLERNADHGSLETEDGVIQRPVLARPSGDIEDHVGDVGHRARMLPKHMTGLLEHLGAVELDERILEVSQAGHEKRSLVSPAESAIDLEGSNVLPGPLGAPGRGFEIAGEFPEVTGLGPAVEIF